MFLAILAGAAEIGQAKLSHGQIMKYLDPTKRPHRTQFHRLNAYAEKALGARNPVRVQEGFCWLDAKHEPVEVFYGGQPLDGVGILHYFHEIEQPAGVDIFWQRPPIAVLSVLADADADFAAGHLDAAHDKYLTILNETAEAGLRGVAMTRLLSVARRLEDFVDLNRFARRLEALLSEVSHPDLQTFFKANAELAFAWHEYSFTRDFDGALSRLQRIGSTCQRFTGLGTEWLNLNALATRRKALSVSGGADEVAALRSIALLENALAEAIAMNNPYQIQQSAANLANLLSLFGQSKYQGIVPYERASKEAVQLLRLASSICARFGIGRDDMFNTIFILSHARRYMLVSDDLPDLLDGATTLAEFAHRESKRLGMGLRAREQSELLHLEGCHAAVREDDLRRFAWFVDAIELDPDTVHSAFRRSQKAFVAEILSIATAQIRHRADWARAVSRLNDIHDYLLT